MPVSTECAAALLSFRYPSNRYASITDMIKDLRWDMLEMRGRHFRLTLMYKLTHCLVDIDSRKYLIQHSGRHTCHMQIRTFLNVCIFQEL